MSFPNSTLKSIIEMDFYYGLVCAWEKAKGCFCIQNTLYHTVHVYNSFGKRYAIRYIKCSLITH